MQKRGAAGYPNVGSPVNILPTYALKHFPRLLSNTTIKCMYTNAQCLTNKLAELDELPIRNSPHVIAITETWFQLYILDCEVNISGMSLLRRDRTNREGGVAI